MACVQVGLMEVFLNNKTIMDGIGNVRVGF
jgi:hypothetical protein